MFHEISVLPDALVATNRKLLDFLGQFVQARAQPPTSRDLDELFELDDTQLHHITSSPDGLDEHSTVAGAFFSWESFTEAMEARHQRGATDVLMDRVNHVTIACPCSVFSTILDKLLSALLHATHIAPHPDIDADAVEEEMRRSFFNLGDYEAELGTGNYSAKEKESQWTTFFPSSHKNIAAPLTNALRCGMAVQSQGKEFSDLNVCWPRSRMQKRLGNTECSSP